MFKVCFKNRLSSDEIGEDLVGSNFSLFGLGNFPNYQCVVTSLRFVGFQFVVAAVVLDFQCDIFESHLTRSIA